MSIPKKRFRMLAVLAATASVALATIAGPAMAAVTVNGAGATFPYPLYTSWAGMYKSKTGVKVNYQGIGSGGGINAIKSGTVLFGATDAPLSTSDLNSSSLVQFPMTIGGVVPIVNLSGVASGKLKLTGAVLADIYLGSIKTWNDSRIKSLNPGVSLPATKIGVVHRSDSSGTSFIFSSYLAAASGSWKSKVGAGSKSPAWPTGIGGKGNEGVASFVKQAKGRIGYVEYAYAKQTRIPYTQLKNKSGKWILPSVNSFKAAAASASFPASNGFAGSMVNSGGTSWPIAGATYILVKKSNKDYATVHAMLQFFNWAYKDSSAKNKATALSYVNIPSKTVTAVESMWHSQIKAGGKVAW
jgi:phosphate transport system substrate-binding protein